MNKVKNGHINKLRYLFLFGVIAFGLIAIVGSGGSGGGGGVVCSVSYTGLSTPAIIDENNAVQLAVGAYTGGVTGTVIATGAVVQKKEVGRSRTLTLIKVLDAI